jgi:hypothetical protein
MTKFLIGVATAALWFALSHAANAERICRQVCDNGTCVSRCVQLRIQTSSFASSGGITTAASMQTHPRAMSRSIAEVAVQ